MVVTTVGSDICLGEEMAFNIYFTYIYCLKFFNENLFI